MGRPVGCGDLSASAGRERQAPHLHRLGGRRRRKGGASTASQCGVRWITHIETHVCDGIDQFGDDFPRVGNGNTDKLVSKTQDTRQKKQRLVVYQEQ